MRRLGLIIAGALLALVAMVAPASAATGSVIFTNAADNPSSFDCYYYTSKSWHKLNDGDSKTISRSTPIKCDADWYIIGFNYKTKKLKKNVSYALKNYDYPLDWALALKA